MVGLPALALEKDRLLSYPATTYTSHSITSLKRFVLSQKGEPGYGL